MFGLTFLGLVIVVIVVIVEVVIVVVNAIEVIIALLLVVFVIEEAAVARTVKVPIHTVCWPLALGRSIRLFLRFVLDAQAFLAMLVKKSTYTHHHENQE